MYFGALKTSDRRGIEIRRPAKIVYHRNFDTPDTANDIALMFVQPGWEIPISNRMRPIEIAPAAYKTPASVTILGWGANVTHGPVVNMLQYRKMRTYEANVCHKFARKMQVYQFCVLAQNPNELGGTCSGDSGGPVTAFAGHTPNKEYLIGVVSYHSPGEQCGICSVYTKVSAYGKWISDQVMDFKKEKPIEGRSSHFDYID